MGGSGEEVRKGRKKEEEKEKRKGGRREERRMEGRTDFQRAKESCLIAL